MALIRRGLVMIDYLARLGTKDTYKAKFEALWAAVDNAHAVDAVQVVRCKDCVYSFRTQPIPPPGKRRKLKHGNECAIHRCYVSNNEFCSRGETLEQKDRREAAYEQLRNPEDGSL